MEKQKAKYTYGILERQFKNTFLKASRKGGITGEVLLQLIESRLDNVIFRLGISPTRDGARQLIGHRHITVNGKVVNIPSYELHPGDIVAVRERSKSMEVIVNSTGSRGSQFPWLEWDRDMLAGKFLNYPERSQIPENIKEQLIVELYSK
jgi:small subunit ribosomal protein S4